MEKIADKILEKSGFKKTELRREVLNIFLKSESALSAKEIESKLTHHADRVTLFRILKDFEEKCVIHKVADNSGNIQFAFCQHIEHNHTTHNNHIHFSCNICLHTFCIEGVEAPNVNPPKGYKVDEWSITLKGTCIKCNAKNS